MTVQQVTDPSLVLAIAASINYPDESALGSAGTHVVYDNHNYLLAIRNGEYLAWDLSVYDDSGNLVTSATDVYISAVTGGLEQSAQEIGSAVQTGINWLPWLLIGFAALYIFNLLPSRRTA